MIKSPDGRFGLLVKYDGSLELGRLSPLGVPEGEPIWRVAAISSQYASYARYWQTASWWTAKLQGNGKLQMSRTISDPGLFKYDTG